jgi:predicted RNase H-like HicB family nuclease
MEMALDYSFDEKISQSRTTNEVRGAFGQAFTVLPNDNWLLGTISSPVEGEGRYLVFFEVDSDDGGLVITIPTLPGCVTEADSMEDAHIFLQDALEGWFAVAEDKGLSIPAPDIK